MAEYAADYGTVNSFGAHLMLSVSPNATIPKTVSSIRQTVYALSGHLVCEFRHPDSKKNEQIGLQAGQWMEICQGMEYSFRSRGSAALLLIAE